ncbi:mannitol-1-phosphate dehydrogenase [Fomitiporia mediterranea MF3/22]|uniref:mannitol-1-phosphate dehydrogenase n=1 Tax=Fomitiporia mediterranea (strain MF3/22) TaxID=694068 RepID=UPI0004407E21|nr:mannitol-1-phosphate dehydrogenase [Fomitiporia mediterranea MF3/22]EJC98054.1 mannitol-1-phosphate dehydrogenase [Fomitiporia mediterranea MF3/22]
MTTSIARTQRAFVLPVVGGPASLVIDHPVVQPDDLLPGRCLVRLTHSGVCHSDLGIKNKEFPNLPKANLVGGHEGVGTVVAIGAHTIGSKVKVGDRVGIKFLATACRNCELCLKGFEGHCPEFLGHGNDVDGTFCEYAVAYVDFVTPIPNEVDSSDAAAIMCAGFTVYSALRQSGLAIGEWLVILGAGGGLGHLAIQYAIAMGLCVIAIDTGSVRKDLCLSLGASAFFDFRTSTSLIADVIAATHGGAHGVLVTAGNSAAYNSACMYLRPTGTLLVVGLPPGAMLQVPVILVGGRGLNVKGVFIGNRKHAVEAIELAAAGKVKVKYTLRGLSELNTVYEEMSRGEIVGRVVLEIDK